MNVKHFFKYESPLGPLIIESDGEKLTKLSFDRGEHALLREERDYTEERDAVLEGTCNWLDTYFGGEAPGFLPPIRLDGTSFQKDVWEILMEIPYGKTVTYGDIAKRIAKKREMKRMAAQAVGGAVGRNGIAIIVPCHRVIGSDGRLTGYAGGMDKKKWLLTLEKAEFLV